ncbi:L-serine dehydratase [Facklamia miroungae]|uniref:L-serine dehydratase n=1 Tax=Facklamia miroungae TaxID=120956 RepID=A0A1G7QLB7_9LACT|nr:L-serine ammonia-lyase, iron-sulfur-dependent, subunit alpha [Facklamia miroungae]SDF99282.1 L-serine dehydratase [Facklamia miroungae]
MSFTSLKGLIDEANEKHLTISQVMIQNEMELRGITEEEMLAAMEEQFDVMVNSVRKGTLESVMSHTGVTGGDGHRVFQYSQKGNSLVDPFTLRVVANAMAVNEVNASMGRIVATPTAGSAGILPACLVHMLDTGNFEKEQLVRAMFTASALGLVIANRASISGAQGGCQAEVGSATSMAAGALVELKGGTPEQVGNAVGLALKNSLGLVCDPVAGLVEIPCIIRNGLHALTAMAAADMALADVVSIIPSDEVIDAMDAIGNELPQSLRETGIGGVAGTPTARRIKEQVFGNSDELVADVEVELSGTGEKILEDGVSASYQSGFEIIGPVMVGPSSSHTAGAVRLGNVARQLLGEEPEEVVFTLMDSFAKTYQGHGTDLALIAGVLGYTTRDSEIADIRDIAEERGLKINFLERNLGNYHPNTARIHIFGPNNHITIIGSSIGGGKIEINKYDEYDVRFSGERPTLIIRHKDKIGTIGRLSTFLQDHDINISYMTHQRAKINGPAITIFEMDQELSQEDTEELLLRFSFIDDLKAIYVK